VRLEGRTIGRSKFACIAVIAGLWSPLAPAAEPKVRVTAELILASDKGNSIDPPKLAKVKDQFAEKGFAFTSYRRLSSEKISLRRKPIEMKLPNHRTASLKLDDLKDGIATVRVEISKLSSTTVALGREGSLFQHAGAYNGGQLILMLSPDDDVQPSGLATLPRVENTGRDASE
jgi:hypothetical protein